MVLAHRATTPAETIVCQEEARDLQSLGRGLAPVATTPAAIIVWPRRTAAKQPSIDPVLARVVLIPAVIIACRASDIH